MKCRIVFLLSLALTGCVVDRSGTRADAGSDAGPRVDAGGADGGRDAGVLHPDAGVVLSDGGRVDAETPVSDAGVDAGFDAGVDAGFDAGVDAGFDAGVDAGFDAGVDAGTVDAGVSLELPVTAGLLVHFDAFNVTGGGSTAPFPPTWRDLAGGDNNGACAGVRFESDGIGPGLPAMVTTGVAGSRCEFPMPRREDLTIYVVFRTGDGRNSGSDWWRNAVIVGGDRGGLHRDGALYSAGGRIGFGRRAGGLQFRDTATYNDGAPHVLGFIRVARTGAVVLKVDSNAAVRGDTDPGDIRAPGHWWLASHENAMRGRFANAYGEVLIYSRVLLLEELRRVREYLTSRWGI